MAKKTGAKMTYKKNENSKRKKEIHVDETDLRDEILDLKRQLMTVKRENEQYLVKLRKYEDEAKRKDKQLEELMDPRKNADVTKFLSTKGAVILMNLRDQNNALIQIILNKDLHIRRLMAELRTTKLYASTSKNENYRAEINRLKNLLIKLEQTLKENNDVKKQRLICVGECSPLELSSTSSSSSPRDLDELRQTISSLESHIKHSNDLLVKKNEEISLLENKINFFEKLFSDKSSTSKVFKSNSNKFQNHNTFTRLNCSRLEELRHIKISNQDIFDFFKKNINPEDQGLSQPRLTSIEKWFSSIDSNQKYDFHLGSAKGNPEGEREPSYTIKNQKSIEKTSEIGISFEKSLFQNIASLEVTSEIKKEEKQHSKVKTTFYTKEIWKRALKRYKELKTLESQSCDNQIFIKKCEKKNKIDDETEYTEGREINNIEPQTKKTLNCQILEEDVLNEQIDSPNLYKKTFGDSQSSTSENVTIVSPNDTSINSEKHEMDECHLKGQLVLQNNTQDEKTTTAKNCSNNSQTHSDFYKTELNEFSKKIYPQSYSFSSDSESSYSMNQEVQQVQVEAQINSLSLQSDSDQLENNQIFEYNEENDGNHTPDLDFNDDDDVIIRQK